MAGQYSSNNATAAWTVWLLMTVVIIQHEGDLAAEGIQVIGEAGYDRLGVRETP